MTSPRHPATEPLRDPDPANEVPKFAARHAAAAAGASDGPLGGDPFDESGASADLDSLRVALRIERARNAELMQALEQSRTAARGARGGDARKDPEVERYRADARALATTLTGREVALSQASASIATLVRANAELKHELEQARLRVGELESGQAAGRAVHDALARASRLARELGAVRARAASYFECLQRGEWRRGVWETQFRELEAQFAGRQGATGVAIDEAARDSAADARIRDLEAALSAVAGSAASGARTLHQELASVAAERELARSDGRRLQQELDAAQARVAAPGPEQQTQVLELERVRGELAERELHMRRLERNLAKAQGHRPAPATPRAAAAAAAPSVTAAVTPAEAQAALIPLGGEATATYRIGARLRIGRASDNDLCLDASSISRHHAMIVWVADGAIIEDLHSANGVWINGQRVRQARLVDGDIVALGILRFRYTAPSPALVAPVQSGA